jgi:hypothetical protein
VQGEAQQKLDVEANIIRHPAPSPTAASAAPFEENAD